MDATRTFYFLFPLLSPFVTTYKKTLFKAHATRTRLKFLKQCKEEQVIPNSLLPRRLKKFSNHPFNEFCALSLKKHIELTKEEEFNAFKNFRRAKIEFHRRIPGQWSDVLLNNIYMVFRIKIYNLKSSLNCKLNNLINNSVWNKPRGEIESNFVNLSSKPLNNNAKLALQYGISFSFNNNASPLDVSVVFNKLNVVKNNLSNSNLDIAKGLFYSAFNRQIDSNFPRRFRKSLNELKSDPDLHITKADKSNSVVILDKSQYLEKMNEILADENTYISLNKNPLENVIKEFNAKLKSILKDKDLIKKFTTDASSLPYMYGLIKTHKYNNPVRPIISSVGSCTYKLSKYLVKILSPLLGSISESHIKNSNDFHDQLCNVDVTPNLRMASFDVVSLFTKVPIDDLFDYLSRYLINHNFDIPSTDIIKLLELCVRDSKFTFNGKFYKQVFGMAMGNPLSPLLANLYMEFFEKNLLPTITSIPYKWKRYVDDVFVLFHFNFDIETFFNDINNLVPSIKFTLEKENNGSLAFLDILIHRKEFEFKFNIYRKPTNNLKYVHYFSGHTNKIKMSVFSSMFLRALRIVSPEYFDAEIHKIYEIGKNLEYPINIITKSYNKAKKIFFANSEARFELKNIICLPFNPNFENLVPLLKNLGITLVFNFKNNIKSLLIRNSPENECNVVYKIPCLECNKFYVGQTSKTLKERIKQHKYYINTFKENSALFQHCFEASHKINWNESKIIANCNEKTKRITLESAIIKKTWTNNLNINEGYFKLDDIVTYYINKELYKIYKI